MKPAPSSAPAQVFTESKSKGGQHSPQLRTLGAVTKGRTKKGGCLENLCARRYIIQLTFFKAPTLC